MHYLEYRALAETTRVQFFLCCAGIPHTVSEDFPWSQQSELPWISAAINVLSPKDSSVQLLDDAMIRCRWIENQLFYHISAEKKTKKKIIVTEITSSLTTLLSILLFISLCGMELFWNSTLHNGIFQGPSLRSVILILFGLISASAVFLSGYYGKLSLLRKKEDHHKMSALYRTSLDAFSKTDNTALYLALAREEIIENGVWLSYCKDNRPGIVM